MWDECSVHIVGNNHQVRVPPLYYVDNALYCFGSNGITWRITWVDDKQGFVLRVAKFVDVLIFILPEV